MPVSTVNQEKSGLTTRHQRNGFIENGSSHLLVICMWLICGKFKKKKRKRKERIPMCQLPASFYIPGN